MPSLSLRKGEMWLQSHKLKGTTVNDRPTAMLNETARSEKQCSMLLNAELCSSIFNFLLCKIACILKQTCAEEAGLNGLPKNESRNELSG